MNYPENFYISKLENNIRWWRQEGCMGYYWGKGEHKEIFFPIPKYKGKIYDYGFWIDTEDQMKLLAIDNETDIFIHDVESLEIVKIIKPSFWTKTYLKLRGYKNIS